LFACLGTLIFTLLDRKCGALCVVSERIAIFVLLFDSCPVLKS
jgi:hypothetical protein